MKLFKAIAATACALAVATAVQAEIYTDSSDNYEYATQLASGVNNGSGFFAWEIETHGEGNGWAGFGVWDPAANGFQGTWAGKDKAFGIIGKGSSYGANALRRFRAPLAVGDSFSLEMGVNWDPNSDIYALKGFSILANGGNLNLLTINHRSNPGVIAINGETDDILDIDTGTYPMKWTFTAKDATTVTITATPRDGSKTVYEKDWNVSTSAIDAFLLQSSGQNAVEDKEAAEAQGENEQIWADRRQTYFDNFQLDIAAPLPDIVTLELSANGDQWAVTNASQTLSFTLKRSSSVGALDVKIASSDPAFVAPATVSFADGVSEIPVTLQATLTGSGNYSELSASASGCEFSGEPYGVRGPIYQTSVAGGRVFAGDSVQFWMDWGNNFIERDDSKLTLVSEPADALVLPSSWTWNDNDGGAWVESSLTANASGTFSLKYDGVVMDSETVEVSEESFSLAGPDSAKAGDTKTYTLTAILKGPLENCSVTVTGGASADPSSFDLATPSVSDPYLYSQTFDVTFGDESATVTVSYLGAFSASIPVTVTPHVDPSVFDGYIAYDEASLYENGFDASFTGAGSVGFAPWTVVNASATYGDTLVYGQDGGFPAILSAGSAFGIYGNGGDDPNYSILRPFADGASLEPGQQISVEFVASEAKGSRSVIFARIWEGTPYPRFEIWNDEGNIGVNVNGASSSLGWPAGARRVVATVQFDPDGSAYTLALIGYSADGEVSDGPWQHVVDVDVGEWKDGIQGVQFRAGNTEGDLVFNRLALEKFADPVKAISWGAGDYNPDGDGDWSITLTANADGVGPVAVSVVPGEGNVGSIALASDTVEFDADRKATIAFTLTGVQKDDFFAISAVPEDTAIAPLDGEKAYGVTVVEPTSEIRWINPVESNTLAYVSGGIVEFKIVGSPARVGQTVYLDTDDADILAPPDPNTAVVASWDGEATTFKYTMTGVKEGKVWIHARDASGQEWGYTDVTIVGTAADDPNEKVLPIKANPSIDGKKMTLSVDGTPAKVFGATEIVERNWAWQPIDDKATLSEGEVTVDMTGIDFMVIKVEK